MKLNHLLWFLPPACILHNGLSLTKILLRKASSSFMLWKAEQTSFNPSHFLRVSDTVHGGLEAFDCQIERLAQSAE